MLPNTFPLPQGMKSAPRILALGAELKSSICLLSTCQRDAGVAQALFAAGDLEHEPTYREFCALAEHMVSSEPPQLIAVDKHPDYLSSKYGYQLGQSYQIPVWAVQHHHAHIAACMLEHGLPLEHSKVLGVAMDGLGFGDDNTLWGAEFLAVDYASSTRVGCFDAMPMLGGAQAVLQPWRSALAYLLAGNWQTIQQQFATTDIIQFLQQQPITTLQQMMASGIHSPKAASCGRLFDAVAAMLCLHHQSIDFEAQAAIALEKLGSGKIQNPRSYPVRLYNDDELLKIDWRPMFPALLTDIQNGVASADIAAGFHAQLANTIAEAVDKLCDKHGFDTVVISGGVFQNKLLLNYLKPLLNRNQRRVLQPTALPAHDGSIAMGQAIVVAAQWLKGQGALHD